jgi:hypothetical protein
MLYSVRIWGMGASLHVPLCLALCLIQKIMPENMSGRNKQKKECNTFHRQNTQRPTDVIQTYHEGGKKILALPAGNSHHPGSPAH